MDTFLKNSTGGIFVQLMFTYRGYLCTTYVYLQGVSLYNLCLPTGGIFVQLMLTYRGYLCTTYVYLQGGIFVQLMFTYRGYLCATYVYLQGVSLYNLCLPIVKQIPLKEKDIAKKSEHFIDYSIIEHINVFT